MTNATSYGALSRAPGFVRNDLDTNVNDTRDQPAGTLTLLRICQYRHTGDPGMFDGGHHFRDWPVGNPFIRTQMQ